MSIDDLVMGAWWQGTERSSFEINPETEAARDFLKTVYERRDAERELGQ